MTYRWLPTPLTREAVVFRHQVGLRLFHPAGKKSLGWRSLGFPLGSGSSGQTYRRTCQCGMCGPPWREGSPGTGKESPCPPPPPSAETKEEATVEENAGDAPTPVWERLLSARFFWGLRRAANRE